MSTLLLESIQNKDAASPSIYVNAAGNVGVGTSTPGSPITVSNMEAVLASNAQTAHDNATLRLNTYAGGGSSIGLSIGGINPNVQYIQGGYNEGTTAPLVLNPYGGNVGIGTSSPNARLHVIHDASEYTENLVETTTKSTLQLKTHAGDSTITTFGGLSGGHAYIQRSNGPGTSVYGLALNPYGGNVGIGVTSPTNGKLEVVHSSSTVPAGYFYNTGGSGNSPALIARGGANNTGAAHTFEVQDYNGNTDFAISGTGVVTMPNQPAFTITQSAGFTGPGIVTFNTAKLNIGNHFNTSTYRFTAPVAGRYQFHYHNNHNNAGGGAVLYFDFYKNGGFIGYGRSYSNWSGGWELLSGSIILELAINDYVQIYLGTTHTADSTSYGAFTGYLLG